MTSDRLLAPKLLRVRQAYLRGQLTLREATMLQNHYAPVRRWRQPVAEPCPWCGCPGALYGGHVCEDYQPSLHYENTGIGNGWRAHVHTPGVGTYTYPVLPGVPWYEGLGCSRTHAAYEEYVLAYRGTLAYQLAQFRAACKDLARKVLRAVGLR